MAIRRSPFLVRGKYIGVCLVLVGLSIVIFSSVASWSVSSWCLYSVHSNSEKMPHQLVSPIFSLSLSPILSMECEVNQMLSHSPGVLEHSEKLYIIPWLDDRLFGLKIS